MTDCLASVMVAVIFAGLGAWIGDVFWAALFGGVLGGLLNSAGAIAE